MEKLTQAPAALRGRRRRREGDLLAFHSLWRSFKSMRDIGLRRKSKRQEKEMS